MPRGRHAALAAVALLGIGAGAAVPALDGGTPAAAQSPGITHGPTPFVQRILADIKPARIEQYDRMLASFGTRHTLSSQDDPNRGVGAARDWIFDQFQQSAAASGGRMTVEKQSFVQPPADRVPEPTTIT